VWHNPHGSFQGDAFAHIKLDNGMTVAKGCESKPATWPGEPHRSQLLNPTQVFGWNKNNQIICRVVDRQRA
jgi:hypothetical protein